MRLDELRNTLDRFRRVLHATTTPTDDGGRRVAGIVEAVRLSQEAERAGAAIGHAQRFIVANHGRPSELPPWAKIVVSDSPDGPWVEAPPEDLVVNRIPIDDVAGLQAALDRAARVVAFPNELWNRLQAHNPGGDHQRFRFGDTLTRAQLDDIDGAVQLLALEIESTTPAGTTGGGMSGVEADPPPVSEIVLTEISASVLRFLSGQTTGKVRAYIADNLPGDRRSIGAAVRGLIAHGFAIDFGGIHGLAITDRGRAWIKAAQQTAQRTA